MIYDRIHHELGRSQNESINESEPKARIDCVGSNQSKECLVAAKATQQQKTIQQANASAAAAATTTTGAGHKLKQGQQSQQQHHHQHHNKNTVLRRKVNNVTKQKTPTKSDPAKPKQQVINRARGTLHGLSTIKRHGNVKVT